MARPPGLRVLFIEVDTERPWAVASIGPACLAAYLRAAGHEVAFLRATVDLSDDEIADQAEAERPALIGLSLTTRQWLRARRLVAHLRSRPALAAVPVIAGGLHPTFAPEETLATPGFDFVCLGEGEGALRDLCDALAAGRDTRGIANIWARGGPRPPLRPPVEPIDSLPYLARDLLDEHPGVVHMATQRGCPFPCTYCAARMYDEMYGEQRTASGLLRLGAAPSSGGAAGAVEPSAAAPAAYGRRRSHGSVLGELRALRDEGPLHYVIFLDDTFTIHHPWVREFCRVYEAEIGAPFSLHARVETVSQDLLGRLAAAGCRQITYGVESGSERLRREVLRRPVTNDRFREVFRWTREAGIDVVANYMLGMPGESRADLQATLDLAAELEVLDFGYFVFYPYPGTRLFQLCRERGYLADDFLERPANHRETVLRLPDLSPEDVRDYYDRFTALQNRRHHGASIVDALAETG